MDRVVGVGGERDRRRRRLLLAAASRFLKSDTDWNLQFCREEAITSQVNIQPPERQRRVLHKAADVWAHASLHRGVCSPLPAISPIWSHLNTHCPARLCTYSLATNCIIRPTNDLISAILGTFLSFFLLCGSAFTLIYERNTTREISWYANHRTFQKPTTIAAQNGCDSVLQ